MKKIEWEMISDPGHGASYIVESKELGINAQIRFDGCINIELLDNFTCAKFHDNDGEVLQHVCELDELIHILQCLREKQIELFPELK